MGVDRLTGANSQANNKKSSTSNNNNNTSIASSLAISTMALSAAIHLIIHYCTMCNFVKNNQIDALVNAIVHGFLFYSFDDTYSTLIA